jgi:hypothetical protein
VYGGGRHQLVALPEAGKDRVAASVDLALELAGDAGLAGEVAATLAGDRLAAARSLRDDGWSRLEGNEAALLVPRARPALVTDLAFEDLGDTLRVRGRYAATIHPVVAAGGVALSPSLVLADARVAAFGAGSRETPVDLGVADADQVTVRFAVGAGAACPQPVAAAGRFGTYEMRCDAGPGGVEFRRSLAVRETWIEPADYAEARGFWRAVGRGDRAAAWVAEAGP